MICAKQYHEYWQTFYQPNTIKPANNRTITGICGVRKAVAVFIIQILFEKLSVVINIEFLVMNRSIIILLSAKEMFENDLDTPIQGYYVRLRNKRLLLAIEGFVNT